jgi:hypothetical protein
MDPSLGRDSTHGKPGAEAVFKPRRARAVRTTNTSARARRGFFVSIVIAVALGLAGAAFAAEPPISDAPAAMAKSLDEQVQEIKSDVLGIAAELGNLEERLLYPSNTQVAIFVSMVEGESVALDSARISIDGELVSHHIYSLNELEALGKGGVQRIYTGNVRTGEHQLEVAISGKRGGGKDFEKVEQFVFKKEVDPKLVGITVAGQTVGTATIAIKDW